VTPIGVLYQLCININVFFCLCFSYQIYEEQFLKNLNMDKIAEGVVFMNMDKITKFYANICTNINDFFYFVFFETKKRHKRPYF
jgi:hypothetical protein